VPATAQQNRQRGLVSVAVFEVIDDLTVVVRDVNVAVGDAANIAANVCGVAVPVAVLSLTCFVAAKTPILL
jgi:class 3 adenylate cyclase